MTGRKPILDFGFWILDSVSSPKSQDPRPKTQDQNLKSKIQNLKSKILRPRLPRRFWAWPSELRRRGVLSMNARNNLYVLPGNPREFYPRVDHKLRTKQICQQHGIPVPETYAVLERNGDIRRLAELIGGRQEFVIKPARGSEGRGIVVIVAHDGRQFTTSSGQRTTAGDLTYHLSTILSGLFSLAGLPDQAILEQRIVRHPVFEKIAVGGTPDLRIILYRCVPVMAMARLPTQGSRGRANLHQGAVAAAVSLTGGRTFGGVCKDAAVSVHPDTGAAIAGVEIPDWQPLLTAAMKLAEVLGLAYVGVDFVLDASRGPVVLEANARPGLSIQVANRCGLTPRLRFLDAQPAELFTPQRRVELMERLSQLD
jgi:alpha-L-glutamate ligase-like protein